MKAGHQRNIAQPGQAQRFPARPEGAVRVQNIQLDQADALAVMRVRGGCAHLVLRRGGDSVA
ncbi:hypothetical protein SDC9_149839 [bioreactor metagenome]|uniref:Uncharacterized protein n=1 Tax=bioreactor metagenome TaxID=1076179 RepID=A0A645EQ13_9ZZZZ